MALRALGVWLQLDEVCAAYLMAMPTVDRFELVNELLRKRLDEDGIAPLKGWGDVASNDDEQLQTSMGPSE